MKESTEAEILTPDVFQKLRDEALDLEMADKFLLSVEQKNRLAAATPFEPGRLYEALRILAAGDLILDSIKIVDSELIAESELGSWREILELRNNRIETYHIRRFYDHSEAPLDMGLLVALARVFRSMPYSESNQSKYDLVVTRLFTKGNVETMRNLRLGREDIADALIGILPGQHNEIIGSGVIDAIKEFDSFIEMLKPLSALDEFVEKDMFEKLRKYKKDMGLLFFIPQVTAAAIECNVTIGNVFAGLVNQTNGPLYDLINRRFDFAGAFHDVAPSAKTELWDEGDAAGTGKADVDSLSDREQIKEILEMIGGNVGVKIDADKEIQDLVIRSSDAGESNKTASERVNPFLTMLSVEKPDFNMIRLEAERFESLRSIDLEYLLSGDSEEVHDLCKDIVAIIVWSEELCANELQSDGPLSETTKSEAGTLIQLSEKYQQELQEMLEDNAHQGQNRLLVASNKLLASHLDIKRFLVEYTTNLTRSSHKGRYKNPQVGGNALLTPLNEAAVRA